MLPFLFSLPLFEIILNYCTLYITKICILKLPVFTFFGKDCHTIRISNLNSDCASGGWSFAIIHGLHDNTVCGLDLVVQTGVQSKQNHPRVHSEGLCGTVETLWGDCRGRGTCWRSEMTRTHTELISSVMGYM